MTNISYPSSAAADGSVSWALRRTGFHAEVQRADDAVVLRLHGELDMATAELLDEAFAAVLDGGGPGVVVDLANLSFLDSTGIASLLGAGQRAKDHGRSFVVRAPRRPVLKALRLTGVDQILAIETDEPSVS
ncbi:MAG: STAS domain-containing protein [Acidimicrobiales bacterium]